MNKYELVKKVAKETGNTQPDVQKIIDATVKVITDTVMQQDDEVQLLVFGTFKVKATAAHKGRNPQTGKTIDIAASKTIAFRPSGTLKVKD